MLMCHRRAYGQVRTVSMLRSVPADHMIGPTQAVSVSVSVHQDKIRGSAITLSDHSVRDWISFIVFAYLRR